MPQLKSFERINLVILLLTALTVLALGSGKPAYSTLLGALAMAANVSLGGRLVGRLLGKQTGQALAGMLLVLKVLIFFAAIITVFIYLDPAPLFFILGSQLTLLIPMAILALR